MAQIKFLVITFLMVGLFGRGECSQDLIDFVRLKMANYSTWLKNNELDPSDLQNTINPKSLRTNDTYAKIDWDIMNHQVSGFSDRHEIGAINGMLTETERYFDVSWTSGAVSFSGEYKANGTVGSQNLPISGEGRWHINVPFVRHTFNFIFFNETESGHFIISSLNLKGILFNFENEAIHFENLFDGEGASGWEAYVEYQMFLTFQSFINMDPENPGNPLRLSYVHYWEKVLSETTMADIIGSGNSTQYST